jgi:hypothetical protein
MVLLALHLLCNYQAVRAVVARTLNRPRLLLLMEQFADTFTVMPLQEANAAEPLLTDSAFCAGVCHLVLLTRGALHQNSTIYAQRCTPKPIKQPAFYQSIITGESAGKKIA